GALDLLRRHQRQQHGGRCQPVQALHRGAAQRGLRRQLLRRHNRRLRRARGHHPALHLDDRLGRRADGLDRRAVPRRRGARPADRAGADGDRPRLRQSPRLPDLPARHPGAGGAELPDLRAGAHHAAHHHRRQDLRLVHRDGERLHRRALRRLPFPVGVPRTGLARPGRRPRRHGAAGRRGAVLRRHGQRLRLAARLLPDPRGAALGRQGVGHGAGRHRLLHRRRVPRGGLLPRRHP
ncbi:MAG: TRAP-type C4-dicarboxylate transport system, large permease component, partial [uncultured Acetobacteraceae bacterium]